MEIKQLTAAAVSTTVVTTASMETTTGARALALRGLVDTDDAAVESAQVSVALDGWEE